MTTMRAGLRSNLRARMRCASRALRNMEQAQPRASRGCLCSSFPLGGIADMIRCLPPKAPTLARTSSSAAGNCENTRLFSSGAALWSSSRRRSRASTFVHHAPSTCSVYVYNKRASSVVVGSETLERVERFALWHAQHAGACTQAHPPARPPAGLPHARRHAPAHHTHPHFQSPTCLPATHLDVDHLLALWGVELRVVAPARGGAALCHHTEHLGAGAGEGDASPTGKEPEALVEQCMCGMGSACAHVRACPRAGCSWSTAPGSHT